VKQFSWGEAAKKLVGAVPTGELLDTNKFIPAECMVEFTVNRKTDASVNDKKYTFIPGVKYVESEGVFEVLWHAGYINKE
jgi:hypothetical protein